jgi:hypothetical protein
MFKEKIRPLTNDSAYDHDNLGVLCYWNKGYRLIFPATPIEDPELFVGKVGQQNLLPGHLTLKPRDLTLTEVSTRTGQTVGCVNPGISGFLFFGDCSARQESLDVLVKSHVGREPTPKNRLYVAQVADVTSAGWTPFFTPLIDSRYPIYSPLHVIFCPNSIQSQGTWTDATEEEKIALAKVFVRWNCM